MWSIGVIIFVLLTGVYPFGSGNDQGIIRLSRRIKNGYDLQFHELILDGYNVVLDSTIFAGVRGGASKEAKVNAMLFISVAFLSCSAICCGCTRDSLHCLVQLIIFLFCGGQYRTSVYFDKLGCAAG